MKTFFPLWLVGCLLLSRSSRAQDWITNYAQYGNVILVKLDSAPFPHPDRAKGHQYHDKFFSAEKNYSDNSVAIFVPKDFHPGAAIDFVVHFHGWGNHVEHVLSRYDLVRQFAESGRNAILVVPQGPYDASDSFGGKLEDENGFERFVNEVMTTLHARGVVSDQPIGDIILSGHSGAYGVMGSIVARGGLSDHIKEVWLFDALYARTDQFMNWFKHTPGARLIDIYTKDGGTREETEKLISSLKTGWEQPACLTKKESELTDNDLRKNHLIFVFTDLEHNDVLETHRTFLRYLRTSRLGSIR